MNARTLLATIAAAMTMACAPALPAAAAVVHPTQPTGQLAALKAHVEDTGAHYNRADWGSWTTKAGCDTRAQVLIREALSNTIRTGRCTITGGTWWSDYDAIDTTNPRALQIDHGVPVKEANRSGARNWTAAQKAAFYNDLDNLTAVTVHSNESKGDRDPGTWKPTARTAWCRYATRWIATKTKYHLTVDDRERTALTAMLQACPPDQR